MDSDLVVLKCIFIDWLVEKRISNESLLPSLLYTRPSSVEASLFGRSGCL
jgi:hypothetical protein